jgi:hypothetical protein
MSSYTHSIKADFVIADNAEKPSVKLIINGIDALELPLEYSKDIEHLCNLLNIEGTIYL